MNWSARFFLLGLIAGTVVRATDLNADSQQALLETQKILTSPMLRNKNVQELNTPAADSALKNAHNLADSSGQTEALFEVSAQVFEQMVKDANGDSEKLQKMMAEAQKNPEKFFDSWSPEQKANVQNIAEKIESKKSIP